MEVKEWQDVKRVAMNAWQVLGALWGIHTNREQYRICNWFWNVAAGDDPGELFPLKQSDLSGRLEHGQGAQPLKETQAMLEYDRTKVAECITRIKNTLGGYDWLITSRGCYSWDDDRWHDEFRRASESLREDLEPLERIAADWRNCPTTTEEIQAARNRTPAAPPEQPQGESMGVLGTSPDNPERVKAGLKRMLGDSAGLADRGEGHCVGTFWSEKEIQVIDALSKKLEMSHVAVIRNALRNYHSAHQIIENLQAQRVSAEAKKGNG